MNDLVFKKKKVYGMIRFLINLCVFEILLVLEKWYQEVDIDREWYGINYSNIMVKMVNVEVKFQRNRWLMQNQFNYLEVE